ncbi:MAG: hypothetical protein H6815_09780 [Phycisphaeraceae bacterium]|nr:hypothetical protein [Phycisphaerales bacterium]MCB9860726.1 hypothetical protein [Phycisphaeraceae bacterium]
MSTNNKPLTGIKEGAGLEDSKINKEFVDFIQRWGGWFLMLGAAALGIVYAYQFLERQKAARVDAAFMEFESAAMGSNPSPDTLTEIGDARMGTRSVGELAKLQAADLYLRSVITGTQLYVNIVDIDSIQLRDQQSLMMYQMALQQLESESALNRDGTPKDPEQLITDEQRVDFLRQARSLYQQVVDSTAGNEDKFVLHAGALFGIASVAETAGELDSAKQTLEQLKQQAEQYGFAEYAASAQKRIDELETLSTLPTLYAKSELPVPPIVEPESVIPELNQPSQLPTFDPGLTGPLLPGMEQETPEDPLSIPGLTTPFSPDPTVPPSSEPPAGQ